MSKLVLGLPKGSLQEPTFALFKRAGFSISSGKRSYFPSVNDPELDIRLLRAQEMSRYIERGMLDAGLTGHDWVVENGSDVKEVCELTYSRATRNAIRWVVAVPEDSDIKTVKDLEGKRIATEAVGLTQRYLDDNGVTAEVEFSWGATEVKAPELVDAIVELTETGNSLRANNLRIMDEILTSTTRLIANHDAFADPAKGKKIEQIALLLRAALEADDKVLLKMNLPEALIADISNLLPSLHAPTVNTLADPEWVSVETVVDETRVRDIIPRLKAAGAQGIIELSLNKVVP